MKTIIGLILGLAVGILLGWTSSTYATPPPTTGSLEQRIQSLEQKVDRLEYRSWTADHAINVVSQRVWDRCSSCNLNLYRDCYSQDLVLQSFAYHQYADGSYATGQQMVEMAYLASTQGQWSAYDNGDGDSFTVTVLINTGGYQDVHISWQVWQSNGFVQGVVY
jgi:hypothetical protein